MIAYAEEAETRNDRKAQRQDNSEKDTEIARAVQHGGFFNIIRDVFDKRPHNDHVEELKASRDDVHQEIIDHSQLRKYDIGGNDGSSEEGRKNQENQERPATGEETLGKRIRAHHAEAHRQDRTRNAAGQGCLKGRPQRFVIKYIFIVLQRPLPGPEPERALRRVRACIKGKHQDIPEGVQHQHAQKDKED